MPFPPPVAHLIAAAGPMPLGPGTPDRAVGDRLRRLTADDVFAPAAVRDPDMARACLAGLWLRHNFLDESHRISQDLHTAEGSFWHGIMHRREGDFGNAKYWFRRVGRHPVFEPLGRDAQQRGVTRSESWDPYLFIDSVEASVARGEGDADRLIALQDREWHLLFAHCYREAADR